MSATVPDPDLEIRGWGGGGLGGLKEKFYRASVWSKNKGWGGGGQAPQGPSPGSASVLFALSFFYPII